MSFFNPLDRNIQNTWINEGNGGTVNISVVGRETRKDGSFSQTVNVIESRRGQKMQSTDYMTSCNSRGQCDVTVMKWS